MVKFIDSLYNAYVGSSSMFEINPVLKTSDNKILAVDAKVNIDDNAMFLRKINQKLKVGLNYVD
jgi:succinyl-CoA synthetase beta subunit